MLLHHELKKTLLSLSYAILLVVLIIVPVTQGVLDYSNEIMNKPKQGEDHGSRNAEIPEVVMPEALISLAREYSVNEYIAYPTGFYKAVKLDDEDSRRMAKILAGISNMGKVDENTDLNTISLKEGITYDEFCDYMKQADDLIGGGSSYSKPSLKKFGNIAITYEDALAEYSLVKKHDRFTGAYARLFTDYLGIVLSFLPVFLGVAICLKDRRSAMTALIYTRKIPSLRLVITRYIAIVLAVVIPTLILAYASNISMWGLYPSSSLDYLAPLRYVMGWILPSIMISASIGMFLTELTSLPIAPLALGIWWFVDLNMGARNLTGGITLWELTPRHNSLGETQVFIDSLSTLIDNRLMYAAISIALIMLTAFIYELRRKGKFIRNEDKTKCFANHANRKCQLTA